MNSVGQFALGICALAIIVPAVFGGDGKSFRSVSQKSQGERAAVANRDLGLEEGFGSGGQSGNNAIEAEEEEDEEAGSGEAVAYRDSGGHFNFEAELNGEYFDVMVDTGASNVAINESIAERIGIDLSSLDFRHTANTANGSTKFARATIDSIRIDGITVYDVEASVLRDDSLSNILLGNSFLSQVNMTTRGEKLVLTQ